MMKGISLGRPEIPAKSPTEGIQIAPASYRAVLQPIDFSALLWRDRAFPKPLVFGKTEKTDVAFYNLIEELATGMNELLSDEGYLDELYTRFKDDEWIAMQEQFV